MSDFNRQPRHILPKPGNQKPPPQPQSTKHGAPSTSSSSSAGSGKQEPQPKRNPDKRSRLRGGLESSSQVSRNPNLSPPPRTQNPVVDRAAPQNRSTFPAASMQVRDPQAGCISSLTLPPRSINETAFKSRNLHHSRCEIHNQTAHR